MVFQALRLVIDVYSEFASAQGGYLVVLQELINWRLREYLQPWRTCAPGSMLPGRPLAKGWALCGANWRGHGVGDRELQSRVSFFLSSFLVDALLPRATFSSVSAATT